MKAGQFELDRDAVAAMEAVTKQQLDAVSGSSPLTTKGDLFGFDTADARLPVGTDGHVLTADAAEALGIKWAAPTGGGGGGVPNTSGVTVAQSAVQSIPDATNTPIVFDAADPLDTDGYHDPATNNTRITIPTGKGGKYLLSGSYRASGTGRTLVAYFRKNGTTTITPIAANRASVANEAVVVPATLVELAEGDYVEVIANQSGGASANNTTPSGCGASVVLVSVPDPATLLEYVETVGNGVLTSFTITHNLNTQNVDVTAWDLSGTDPETVGVGVKLDNTDPDNAIVVTTDVAPATDELKIVVMAAGVESSGGAALGEWTDYTPTWTSGGTTSIGNGTLVGRYKAFDANTYAIQVYFIWGSTTSDSGTGQWVFSLPPGLTAATGRTQILAGWVLDAGTDNKVASGHISSGATTIGQIVPEGSNVVTKTAPMTWTTNDQFALNGIIEVA